MILSKWKAFALAATLVGTLAGSATVVARQFGGGGLGGATQKPSVAKGQPSQEGAAANSPVESSPSPRSDPAEALTFDKLIAASSLPDAKMSEAQLAAARVSAAKQRLDSQCVFYENGTITIDRMLDAAERYMNARVQLAGEDRATALKAIEDHVRIAQSICNRENAKFAVGQSALPNVSEAELNLIEAKILLAQARSGQDKPAAAVKGRKVKGQPPGNQDIGAAGAPVPVRADVHGVGQPAESDDPDGDKKVMAELAKPISMPFAQETPLEDVIKYIKTATTSPIFEQGLPIYIEPEGLQSAEKTMDSPIKLNLEGIKLKTTLRLVLKQHGLGYYVKHGLVIITNLDDEDFKDATQTGWRDHAAQDAARAAIINGMGGGGMGGAGGIPGGGGGMR